MMQLLWQSKARQDRFQNEHLMLPHIQEESKLLVQILMTWLKRQYEHSHFTLVQLLTVFYSPTLSDFTFFKDFLRDEVALKFNAKSKRMLVMNFLDMLQNETINSDLKILTLQLLITPLLAATFEHRFEQNSSVVDDEIIRKLMHCALDTTSQPPFNEPLRIEVMMMMMFVCVFCVSFVYMHKNM
jgi:hypothetical protein